MALGFCPCGAHLTNAIGRHGRLAAAIDAPLLCGLDARLLALADEPALHLGDHAEHRHEDRARGVLRREGRLEHGQRRALRLELVHEVEDVAGRAAEPVELDDDELVAGADELDDRSQLVAALAALAAGLLGSDDLAAGGVQPSLLGGVVLIERRDTRA